MEHSNHNMQVTSLLNYFPGYSEEEFNQKFRQQTKRQIIGLLQQHHNLTDREMTAKLFYDDPNKVRPKNFISSLSISTPHVSMQLPFVKFPGNA